MANFGHLKRKEKLLRLFEKAGIKPQTRRGQNFLLDRNQVRYIAKTGEIIPSDVVVEVGPGTGFLTRELAPYEATVIGVEVDRKLLEIVRDEVKEYPNVLLMQADILHNKNTINPDVTTALAEIMKERGPQARLKTVSNLPYSAGTPFVANLFSSELPWDLAVCMLQLEVAQRLVAKPGTSAYGNFSILAELGGKAKIERKVPPPVFWPRPKVASAVVSIRFKSVEERMLIPWRALRKVTTAIFSSRRKTLRNSLKGLLPDKAAIDATLAEVGLSEINRGEQMTPQQFLALAKHLEAKKILDV